MPVTSQTRRNFFAATMVDLSAREAQSISATGHMLGAVRGSMRVYLTNAYSIGLYGELLGEYGYQVFVFPQLELNKCGIIGFLHDSALRGRYIFRIE